jgi:hypothetical protein
LLDHFSETDAKRLTLDAERDELKKQIDASVANL